VSLVERNLQMYGTTICRQEDGRFGPPLPEDPDHVLTTGGRSTSLEHDIRRIDAFHRRID
jgi:hypothetical protein